MAIDKEVIEKARKYLEAGKTQEQAAELVHVTPRTIRRWKQKGYFQNIGREKIGSHADEMLQVASHQEEQLKWSDITAADLVTVGFMRNRVHFIMAGLGIAEKQGNIRLLRYLKSIIEISNRWREMPEGWRAALAGIPIVSEDIQSPSLLELMHQARRIHPYLSKEALREYHRVAKNILIGVLAEVQAFLQDASMAGGLPIMVIPEGPAWMPWTKERSFRMDDRLLKGKWTFGIPKKFANIKFGDTWAGVLFDIISRLPDPDRQRGKIFKKAQLTGLLYLWSSTAPSDFRPPLLDIQRQSRDAYKGTPADLYYDMASND